jgi:exosortase
MSLPEAERSGSASDGNRSPTLLRLAPGIALLVVLIASYGPVVIELVQDWIRDPNYHHGFLIPIVSGYLLWNRRRELVSDAARPSWFGLVGILLAAAMLILGSAGAEVFTQRLSLLVLVGSLVLFFYGWRRLRRVAFPLAFLLFAIPLPYLIYYGLTGPMQALAAKCAILGLKAIGVPLVAQGNVIHLANGSLEVAEACSGIRSLYAFLALGALVAQSTSVPIWGRLLIFLATIPLSIIGNAVRVWASGVGTCLVGPGVTRGTPHELFGLLVFAVSLGVFLLFKKVVGNAWSRAGSSPSPLSGSPGSTPEGSEAGDRQAKPSPPSSSSPSS